MEKIWIIGAGKFGIQAAKQMSQKEQSYSITLVDLDETALERAKCLGCDVIARDGSQFLNEHLARGRGPDWIIPALPVHLAFEWCALKMGKEKLAPFVLPKEMDDFLPNPMRGADTQIYVSHANFICPPNCNEPDDRCTKTRKPRKEDMFALLVRINIQGITPFVIQSSQLGPGVGGYRPTILFDLLDRLSLHKGPCFVATACRCHGVMSGVQVLS
jgi:hypothetical protein